MKKVILGAILVAESMAASAGIVMPNCGSECWNHQNIGASPCVAAGTCGSGVLQVNQTPPPPPACTWQNETAARQLQRPQNYNYRYGTWTGPIVGPSYVNSTGTTIYVSVENQGYVLSGWLNGQQIAQSPQGFTAGTRNRLCGGGGYTCNSGSGNQVKGPVSFPVGPGDTYAVSFDPPGNTVGLQAQQWLECR